MADDVYCEPYIGSLLHFTETQQLIEVYIITKKMSGKRSLLTHFAFSILTNHIIYVTLLKQAEFLFSRHTSRSKQSNDKSKYSCLNITNQFTI